MLRSVDRVLLLGEDTRDELVAGLANLLEILADLAPLPLERCVHGGCELVDGPLRFVGHHVPVEHHLALDAGEVGCRHQDPLAIHFGAGLLEPADDLHGAREVGAGAAFRPGEGDQIDGDFLRLRLRNRSRQYVGVRRGGLVAVDALGQRVRAAVVVLSVALHVVGPGGRRCGRGNGSGDHLVLADDARVLVLQGRARHLVPLAGGLEFDPELGLDHRDSVGLVARDAEHVAHLVFSPRLRREDEDWLLAHHAVERVVVDEVLGVVLHDGGQERRLPGQVTLLEGNHELGVAEHNERLLRAGPNLQPQTRDLAELPALLGDGHFDVLDPVRHQIGEGFVDDDGHPTRVVELPRWLGHLRRFRQCGHHLGHGLRSLGLGVEAALRVRVGELPLPFVTSRDGGPDAVEPVERVAAIDTLEVSQ